MFLERLWTTRATKSFDPRGASHEWSAALAAPDARSPLPLPALGRYQTRAMAAPTSTDLFDQFARGWRGCLIILAIAVLSSQFGATRLPVMDRDEARFAQASRQMVETGDYVRIRLQDEERNKKPIGIYWLQAAAAHAAEPILGRLNAIWPYRLPSALGAALAALGAFWAGSALLRPRAAFVGAALFASGMLIGFESGIAKTDAMLAGVTTLAMAALAHLYSGTTRPRLVSIAFWAALGAGVLIKGPVTPMVAGLALLTLAVWERRASWMKPLTFWPGPLLAVLIVAPWMIAIGMATEGRFFSEAVGGDLAPKLIGGQEGHFAWPGFHTLLLPFLIFPATFALPAAARMAWGAIRAPRNDVTQGAVRFLLAWAAPTFLAFELLPTKLPHYTLPAYPAIALLCGAALMALRGKFSRVVLPVGFVMFVVVGAALTALLAVSATFAPGDSAADLRRAISAVLVGAGILGGASAGLLLVRSPTIRAGILVACALAISFSLRDRLLPEARTLFVSREVVAELARERLTPHAGADIWTVGYGEPSLVFLTRTSLRIAAPAEAGAGARVGDTMIVEGRVLDEVRTALAARNLVYNAATDPVRGLSMGRGKRVALYIGRVGEAPISDAPAGSPPRSP